MLSMSHALCCLGSQGTCARSGYCVLTASSSGVPTIQIQQNSLDILSTELTIDVGEKTSRTAATPVVIADTTLDTSGVINFDLDIVGTGVAGLVIYLVGYQRF